MMSEVLFMCRLPFSDAALRGFAIASLAFEMPIVTRARIVGLGLRPCVPTGRIAGHGDHIDAVDGAWRDTEVAARAHRLDDGMHALGRADDRIDRASLDT